MSPDFTLAFSICPPFSLSTSRGGGRRGHRSASVRKGNTQDGSQDLTPTRPPLGGGSAGEGVKGTQSPDARHLVEAPRHSLGCAYYHLRADRLLVAQIRAYSRLLSPTPFFKKVFTGSPEQTTRGRRSCREAKNNHQGFFCVVLFRSLSSSSNPTESAEHSGARRVWGSSRARKVGLFSPRAAIEA